MRIDLPNLVGNTIVTGSLEITGSVSPGSNALYDFGTSTKRWNNIYSSAFSGSLTKLSSGADYLVAGTGIQLTTGSSGNVTIAATVAGSSLVAGSNTQVQFNDGGTFGANSLLTYNKNTGALTGTFLVASTGFSGSLTKLSNGSDYLLAGNGIQITTGSSGNITIASTAITSPGGSNTQVQFNDSGTFSGSSGLTFNKLTSALTGGYIVASTGFSGSLTKLSTGSDFLVAGTGIQLTTGSSGNVTIASTVAGSSLIGGSNTQVQFNDSNSFGGDSGLIYNKTTQSLTGTYIVASSGFTGSLTKLTDGTNYLIAGSNIQISTGSNGSITIDSAVAPYTTTSFTNVTTVVVNHSIGLSLYDIEVFDTTRSKIFPKSITATSSTQATILFGSPTSGFVIVGSPGGSGGSGGGGGASLQSTPVYTSFTNDVTLDKVEWTVISSGSNFLRTSDITTTGRAVFVNANMTFYSNDPTTTFFFTFARSNDAGSTWTNVVDSTSIASSNGKLQTVSVGNVTTNIIPVNMTYFDSSLIDNSGNYRYAVYYKSNSGTGSLGVGNELCMLSAYEV